MPTIAVTTRQLHHSTGHDRNVIMSTVVMSAAEDTPLKGVKRTILQKYHAAKASMRLIELIELGPNAVDASFEIAFTVKKKFTFGGTRT
jgi:hypothetical protein